MLQSDTIVLQKQVQSWLVLKHISWGIPCTDIKNTDRVFGGSSISGCHSRNHNPCFSNHQFYVQITKLQFTNDQKKIAIGKKKTLQEGDDWKPSFSPHLAATLAAKTRARTQVVGALFLAGESGEVAKGRIRVSCSDHFFWHHCLALVCAKCSTEEKKTIIYNCNFIVDVNGFHAWFATYLCFWMSCITISR